MPTTFTTLPLEVRNEIYTFVFDHDRLSPCDNAPLCKAFQYEHSPDGHWPWVRELHPQQTLALLSVSQQISDEAAAYFYGNTIFYGYWPLIAAFVKGIGAQRRNMIRRIEIDWKQSLFKDDENLDMLAELTGLQTVHMYAITKDFTHLQNDTIPGCISGLVGKVDIGISVFTSGECLSDTIPPVQQLYTDENTWSCARNTAQWTCGEPIRGTFPKSSG